MKLNENYTLRSLAGKHMLVNESGNVVNLVSMFKLNGTAAWFWNKATGREFEIADITNWLLQEFELTDEQAAVETSIIMDMLTENNLVID